jgi:hypothetical protein
MDMKRLMMILMAAALVALPTMSQSFGSKRSVENDQQAAQSYTTTEPFRSTSAMQTSGSAYSPNPTLEGNGTASYGGSVNPINRGLRKVDSNNDGYDDETGLPVTSGTGGSQQPLGDAVWPLMLMALAYLGVRVFFRRRRAE